MCLLGDTAWWHQLICTSTVRYITIHPVPLCVCVSVVSRGNVGSGKVFSFPVLTLGAGPLSLLLHRGVRFIDMVGRAAHCGIIWSGLVHLSCRMLLSFCFAQFFSEADQDPHQVFNSWILAVCGLWFLWWNKSCVKSNSFHTLAVFN